MTFDCNLLPTQDIPHAHLIDSLRRCRPARGKGL